MRTFDRIWWAAYMAGGIYVIVLGCAYVDPILAAIGGAMTMIAATGLLMRLPVSVPRISITRRKR